MVDAQWLAQVVTFAQASPDLLLRIKEIGTPQVRTPFQETVLPMWEHRIVKVVKVVGSYANLYLDMVECMNAGIRKSD